MISGSNSIPVGFPAKIGIELTLRAKVLDLKFNTDFVRVHVCQYSAQRATVQSNVYRTAEYL